MSKSHIVYLQHILQECYYVTSVVTDSLPMYQFLSDETLKRAVTRSLEIIGEATKKIPADVKYEWNDISWKQMAGMRDKLIHDYMGVNYLIVWDVAKNIIPVLIPQIEAIIDKEKENRINR
ncbi:DUF86 domain-containing protein [Parabacteroides faecis]|uniref:HepT-like ribonuclease domain-containing protein n=1 Tax=Parabacteroides faecis TaxID=1217282 RepID=UPI0021644529|nr:DUF86 domain-containing protein [Parabacteroides faecis]MCS2894463.1 DUF86 domain-containing protein [Parabacteroides faecis]UVQ46948.1 DUF86 domain-containing protein [Parabacteroides faecis]